MNIDTFFAYSKSTAAARPVFPAEITDMHGRPYSIVETSKKYRLFVLILAAKQDSFVSSLLQSVKAQLKTFHQDSRWLILSPGRKEPFQALPHQPGVTWLHSPALAQHLQVYIHPDEYLGHFLLEIHPSRHWQLLYQFAPTEGHSLAWLGQSLAATRAEWEQRSKISVKVMEERLAVLNTTPHDGSRYHRSSTHTIWGWHDCPMEIRYAILDQMSLRDVVTCARASYDLNTVILPYLLVKIHTHLVPLKSQLEKLPFKALQDHERGLSGLSFQLQTYLSVK